MPAGGDGHGAKVIRDPVHDVIALRPGDRVEGLLFRLVNAREVQRLRRVRQLGMASLAYPGADHSRYSHSLGVMQTARRVLDRLARETAVTEDDRLVVLTAALLHDLGHGPFSHVFERVTGLHHERLTARVINDPESDVHQTLIRHDKTLPERVVALLDGAAGEGWRRDVISSQLDADRLDYLLRDNLHTGSRYGRYDLTWLVQAMTVSDGRLAVLPKGLSAVEAYLMARYHMYRNVYFHKVVRSAEGMVRLALGRAKDLAAAGELAWPAGAGCVGRALAGDRLTMRELLDLDDAAVTQCFKVWAADARGEPVLSGLCRDLLDRRMFKTLDLAAAGLDPADAQAEAHAAVRAAGGEPAMNVLLDVIESKPYLTAAGDFEAGRFGKEILIATTHGPTPLAELSPSVAALAGQLRFERLQVHPDHRDAVAAALGINS